MTPQLDLFGEPIKECTPHKSKADIFNNYDGFVDKFKPKKTTDDCYTPPEIYECVKEWVNDNILPLDGLTIRRPFKPGGDYQTEAREYGEADVVLDNPPFSILSKIIDFYTSRGIKFFLFAPALTLFSSPRAGVSYICAGVNITYVNGAVVRTSFITNMEGMHRIIVAGDLFDKIEKTATQLRKAKAAKELTVWAYPNEVVTSALLGKVVTRGISFKVPFDECEFIRKLDNQQGTLFGGGYLLSERAAAERAAAERAAAERRKAHTVELSPRELQIVKALARRDDAPVS